MMQQKVPLSGRYAQTASFQSLQAFVRIPTGQEFQTHIYLLVQASIPHLKVRLANQNVSQLVKQVCAHVRQGTDTLGIARPNAISCTMHHITQTMAASETEGIDYRSTNTVPSQQL
jgi:hypothetical protein